ncbi:SAM domain-containing protein [Caballeronia sp. INDeC2]|nr:SAM domain-containing protein [Caballeronia sp. INDeC2]
MDVAAWLRSFGMERYEAVFREHRDRAMDSEAARAYCDAARPGERASP